MSEHKKLNLGAGYGWKKDGWETLDHGDNSSPFKLTKQAWDLPYSDETFEVIFCSHMFEHISHHRIEKMICEINRIMKKDGILRILTPDLKKLASAYVKDNNKLFDDFFKESKMKSNPQLGLGHSFIRCLVSSGGDSWMLSSDFSEVIGGYAHVFCYDYNMLAGLLKFYGFNSIKQCSIDESKIEDHKELRGVPYDRYANITLVIECQKNHFVPFNESKSLLVGKDGFDVSYPKKNSPLGLTFRITGHVNSMYKYLKNKK